MSLPRGKPSGATICPNQVIFFATSRNPVDCAIGLDGWSLEPSGMVMGCHWIYLDFMSHLMCGLLRIRSLSLDTGSPPYRIRMASFDVFKTMGVLCIFPWCFDSVKILHLLHLQPPSVAGRWRRCTAQWLQASGWNTRNFASYGTGSEVIRIYGPVMLVVSYSELIKYEWRWMKYKERMWSGTNQNHTEISRV